MKSTSEILKAIQDQKYAPVYLLSGKEKFFHDQIIEQFAGALFSDPSSRSLNRIILHGGENTLSEVVNAALSYPMLSNYKLVVVKEFSRIKTGDADSFYQYLKAPTQSTVLVLSTEEMGKTKVFTELRKQAVLVDCKPVPEYKFNGLIKERLKQNKMDMDPQAVAMLAEYTGNSVLNVEQELYKIKEYVSSERQISVDDIVAVTGMSKEYNVFALQKMLVAGDLKQSYRISKKLMEKGENVNLIISVLYNYFKKALFVAKQKSKGKDVAAISRELKINEYQQRDISTTLKRLSPSRLESIIALLHTMDKNVKNSLATDWAVMQTTCYKICRQ